MGASLCKPDEQPIGCAASTVHACHFPLWAVKVSDFMQMRGAPEPHNVLQEKGVLHQYYPGMFVIFVSHQWLSSVHPDPQGAQMRVLQKALAGVIDGTVQITENIVAHSYDEISLASDTQKRIADAFLFFDWFAIPQITARTPGVNEETTKTDAALAVQSIPAYVELCDLFLALVPELTHKDSAQRVNYTTWMSRGWCRAELWCRLLSNKSDTSVIVAYSATEAEFMFPLDWQNRSIVDGDFTVEADRTEVVRLGEMAVESKIRHLQDRGPLSHYRFWAALCPNLLRQQRKWSEMDAFLRHFKFASLREAVQDDTGMNAVMCAVFSGDTNMLRSLAGSRANMNHTLEGMSELGYYDTQTALMAATKSRQDVDVLRVLLECRADVNGCARTGLTAIFLCRTPEHVKILLEHRADMPDYVLAGAASFACPETVKALISHRCDASKAEVLHSVALMSRSNGRALETAKLLLAHRADVNEKHTPMGELIWYYRKARFRAAVVGLSNCSMSTRFWAARSGISPLGVAALVGHEQLVQLFLEYGAEPFANDSGHLPEDLARCSHHHHLLPMLSTFAT
ncbi:unnamed protein product [Symbiodinium natans]|uniref:Uncharacterized protein n=1 Tax=Symbiodinium natans TaxID=878477 RepID=A0A812JJR0_9DINO|nr:unnamed protein product [Symbiodinium natans]